MAANQSLILTVVWTLACASCVRHEEPTTANAAAWGHTIAEAELTIGVLEGQDQYAFGSLAMVAVAPDGGVYVVDRHGPIIRRYDVRGQYVHDVGRVGSGPGEYRAVTGVAYTRRDGLAVFDPTLKRISFYSENGRFTRSIDSHSAGYHRENALREGMDGNLLVLAMKRRMVQVGDQLVGTEGPGNEFPYFLRISPRGRVLDSLFVNPPAESRELRFSVQTPEGTRRPFVREFLYAVSPQNALVTAFTDAYELEVRSRDHTKVVQRQYTPIRLAPEERAQWQGRADYYTRTLPSGARSAGVVIPEYKPPIRSLYIDEEGLLWVQRYVEGAHYSATTLSRRAGLPPLTWREPVSYDVVRSDGTFVGTVRLPPRTQLLYNKGDVMWGVKLGEFDEQYLVRLRRTAASG